MNVIESRLKYQPCSQNQTFSEYVSYYIIHEGLEDRGGIDQSILHYEISATTEGYTQDCPPFVTLSDLN